MFALSTGGRGGRRSDLPAPPATPLSPAFACAATPSTSAPYSAPKIRWLVSTNYVRDGTEAVGRGAIHHLSRGTHAGAGVIAVTNLFQQHARSTPRVEEACVAKVDGRLRDMHRRLRHSNAAKKERDSGRHRGRPDCSMRRHVASSVNAYALQLSCSTPLTKRSP